MKKLIILAMSIIMLYSAAALDISSPVNRTYNTTAIGLSVSHNERLDNLTYSLDGKPWVLACLNCSSYGTELEAQEGSHHLSATGYIGNQSYTDTVDFSVDLPEYAPSFSMDIVSPVETTYSSQKILFKVQANDTLDKIRYKIDDHYITACENCSSYSTNLTFSEGTHSISVRGILGDSVRDEDVEFVVDLDSAFTFRIISPEHRDYTGGVPVNVESNTTLDRITVKIGNVYTRTCYNCSSVRDTINLTEGGYTLKASSYLGSARKDYQVAFSVNSSHHEDDESEDTNESDDDGGHARFTTGFEKLPKMLESGEISDSDLADIIRHNQLNPGVINRLIKTGKLGQESIDAILETQSQPKGIFRRFLSFIGFREDTYASMIYESYNLSRNQEQNIVARDDLPRGYAKKITEKLEKETVDAADTASHNYTSKPLKVGKQELPPGQAKKQEKQEQHGKGKKD